MMEHIVESILNELENAKRKWPDWVSDPVHAAAIVSEEAGELMQAALDYSYSEGATKDMIKEAIQTGAMAIRFLENIGKYEKVQTFIGE